jgi:hypothetical protein
MDVMRNYTKRNNNKNNNNNMIHNNSLASYGELDGLNKRCRMVVSALSDLGVATDRGVKEHLNLPDMNNVRPRVTELLKLGIVVESGSELCEVTKKTVRKVKLAVQTDQMEMF